MGKRTTIRLINVYNVDITDLSFACASVTHCLLEEASCTWESFANTILSCFEQKRKVSCEEELRLYLGWEWRIVLFVYYRKRKDRERPRDPNFIR